MLTHDELSTRLKTAREAAGLTQAELARRAGLSLYTLAKLEQGKVTQPSFFTILSLVEQLNISLDTLCGLAVNTSQNQSDDAWSGISWCFVDVSVLIDGWFDAISQLAQTIGVDSVKLETLFLKHKHALMSGKTTVYEFEQIIKDTFGVSSRKIDLRSLWFDTLHTPEQLAAQLRQFFSNGVQIGAVGQIGTSLLEEFADHDVLPPFLLDQTRWVLNAADSANTHLLENAERTADVLPKQLLLVSDSTELVSVARSRNWNVKVYEP